MDISVHPDRLSALHRTCIVVFSDRLVPRCASCCLGALTLRFRIPDHSTSSGSVHVESGPARVGRERSRRMRRPPMGEERTMERLVVVGNGMAGMGCLEQILKYDPPFQVTVFGDETHVNYNRVLLSSVLAGEKADDDIILNGR